MSSVQHRNYFLEKLLNDRKINKMLEDQGKKQSNDFFKQVNELRRILHIKQKTDSKIFNEYNSKIIIPTGSEDTLIRELNIFNKLMYDDLPENYTLDYPKEVKKNDYIKSKPAIEVKKNILNLSNSYVEQKSIDLETISTNYDINNLLDDKIKESKILEDNEIIYLNSEEEKETYLENLKNDLEDGNYKKLNLKKPLSITCTRYMYKLNNIKKAFINTYGNEMFKRIRDSILEEENLYNNINRNNKVEKLKIRKYNIKRKKQNRKIKF